MIFGVLMFFFIILCIFLTLFIFIQQGKGGLGQEMLGSGAQTIFGGSGGQTFFEKATWIMGALFMVGSLGLSLVRLKTTSSRVQRVHAPVSVDTSQDHQQPTPTPQKQ